MPCEASVVTRAAEANPPTDSMPTTLRAPPHNMIQNTARLNAYCGTKRPNRPAVTKPNRLLAHSSALLLKLGVARQEHPDED